MEGFLHAFEVREVFTGPVDLSSVSLSGSATGDHSWDRFSEGFFAGFAPESSFSDDEFDADVTEGAIVESDSSSVISC